MNNIDPKYINSFSLVRCVSFILRFLGLLHEREREREYISIYHMSTSVCLSVGPPVCQSVFDKAVTNIFL